MTVSVLVCPLGSVKWKEPSVGMIGGRVVVCVLVSVTIVGWEVHSGVIVSVKVEITVISVGTDGCGTEGTVVTGAVLS